MNRYDRQRQNQDDRGNDRPRSSEGRESAYGDQNDSRRQGRDFDDQNGNERENYRGRGAYGQAGSGYQGGGTTQGAYGDQGYDQNRYDQFGQSYYSPRQHEQGGYGQRQQGRQDEQQEGPGWGNYTTQRQNYGRQQQQYGSQGSGWTPQYQNYNQSNDPYDQRRADPYQSAGYNPRRSEFGVDRGYGQEQESYGQAQYGQSYGQNRQQSGQQQFGGGQQYGGGQQGGGYESPYRGNMMNENTPRYGMGQSDSMRQSSFGRAPKGYKRSDERIKEEVCDALMSANQIDPSDIEVSVSEGEVTLKGEVCCRNDKHLAETICERVLGVNDVITHLRVKKQGQSSQSRSSGSSGYSAGQESDSGASARSGQAMSSSTTKESKYAASGNAR